MSQEYGITDSGFNLKPIDVIEEDVKDNLKQNFGTEIDVSQKSPTWRFAQSLTTEMALLWSGLEGNFFNNYGSTASGAGLRLYGETLGVEFKEATKSEVTLKIIKSSPNEVTVPALSQFQTSENVVFATDEELVIPAGDPASTFGYVSATALVAGESGNVGIGSILIPTNTLAGVASSTNEEDAIGGTDDETDNSYRKRITNVVRSTYTKAVLRRQVLNVEGVKGVKIVELDYSYIVRVAPLTELTPELEAAISVALDDFNPITVEYEIIESINVLISVTADVHLKTGYNINIANSEVSTRINDYLEELSLDDDVIKNRIIHEIMDYIGIDNFTNLVISAEIDKEPLTYLTGTDEYDLIYPNATAITEVTGILSSTPHTFIEGVDYQLLTSPARIDWSLGGNDPDNDTEFYVSYTIPPDVNGDIQISEESIAKLNTVVLTQI